MSFSVFTKFKAQDGVTPAFNSMIQKGNSFQAQAGKIQNAFGRMFRSVSSGITRLRRGFSTLTDKIFNIKNALMGSFIVIGIQKAYGAIKGFVQETVEAAKAQTIAETKLYTILKNVHSVQARGPEAYKQAGNYLSNMATKLQRVGVIGDEITLAGFQQLATFQMSDKEIGILAGGMSDLLTQQKGLNATQQDAVNIANLMGKVMDGQVGALRRVGVSFTKAEEKVLKTGNRIQRAAMLAKVLKNNVGGVNEAIAKTPEGKIQNMTNQWSDMYENIGIKLMPILAEFAGWFAPHIPQIEAFIIEVINNIMRFKNGIINMSIEFQKWYNFIINNSDKIIAAISGIATVAIIANFNNLVYELWAMKTAFFELLPVIWSSVRAFAAQTGALLANPMTWVVLAIGAVVAGLVLLALNWDKVKAATLDFVQKAKSWILDLWQKIEPIFEKIKKAAELAFKFSAIGAVVNITRNINERRRKNTEEKIPGFAKGTDYFKGGIALVGERGPELAEFPTGTKIYNNNKTVSMIENMSKPRFNKVLDFDKYKRIRDEKQVIIKETIIKQQQEAERDNVIYLELDLNVPEGYEAKVVNAKSSSGKDFKVRLKGKTKQ